MFFCAFTAHILLLSGCAGLLLPEPTPVRPEAQSATQDNRAQETPQSASAAQAAERSPEMIFQALAAADRPYQRGGQSHASGFDSRQVVIVNLVSVAVTFDNSICSIDLSDHTTGQ